MVGAMDLHGAHPIYALRSTSMKKITRLIYAGLIVRLCLLACSIPTYAATQAFNTSTGQMDVNYAGYLSRNDVVFNAPITTPINGTQVGNGRVGMMVWNANGMSGQISGIDTSEQSSFSAGQLNLQTN